jgi:hypothetical protein
VLAGMAWGAYILLTQDVGHRFTGISGLSITIPIAAGWLVQHSQRRCSFGAADGLADGSPRTIIARALPRAQQRPGRPWPARMGGSLVDLVASDQVTSIYETFT